MILYKTHNIPRTLTDLLFNISFFYNFWKCFKQVFSELYNVFGMSLMTSFHLKKYTHKILFIM